MAQRRRSRVQRRAGARSPRCSIPTPPVPGVTQAPLRSEIAALAVPATSHGRNMKAEDFAVTAGWGHHGRGDAVMPGQGRAVKRVHTPEEHAAMGEAIPVLGETTFDIHLDANAFWRNVPAAVWGYRLGGYQVLEKWLSYRERSILGRALRPGEVQDFTDIARRIAAITLTMRACGHAHVGRDIAEVDMPAA